jgi:flagellar FliJ protein
MKRFHFPLRPVAVLRAHKELRAREAFAVSVHAYVQTEERLAHTRKRVAEMEQLLFAGRSERFGAADAATLFRVYRADCHTEVETEREVIAAKDVMNQRRAEYIEANRQLKIIHRLEEKARNKNRLENARIEQNELDEFAGYRASRRPALS